MEWDRIDRWTGGRSTAISFSRWMQRHFYPEPVPRVGSIDIISGLHTTRTESTMRFRVCSRPSRRATHSNADAVCVHLASAYATHRERSKPLRAPRDHPSLPFYPVNILPPPSWCPAFLYLFQSLPFQDFGKF